TTARLLPLALEALKPRKAKKSSTLAPLLMTRLLKGPLLPTYRFAVTDQRLPGSVTTTELPAAFVPAPMKPRPPVSTVAPLLTIIWFRWRLDWPTVRSSALLQSEPAPVMSARLLLAEGFKPIRAAPSARTVAPLLMTRRLYAPLLPTIEFPP